MTLSLTLLDSTPRLFSLVSREVSPPNRSNSLFSRSRVLKLNLTPPSTSERELLSSIRARTSRTTQDSELSGEESINLTETMD
jgi:hypothetical protein